MNTREQEPESLGYPLDRWSPEGSLIAPLAIAGNLFYASRQVSFDNEQLASKVEVPSHVSIEVR